MRRSLLTLLLVSLASLFTFAQTTPPVPANGDVRSDRHDLRKDRRDRKSDKRDLRQDRADRNKDQRDINADRRDLEQDRAERKKDIQNKDFEAAKKEQPACIRRSSDGPVSGNLNRPSGPAVRGLERDRLKGLDYRRNRCRDRLVKVKL